MKLNSKIVVALLLCVVAAITVGMVAAEDLTLPDGATFTVPDGFTVQDDGDGNTALVKDDLAIIVLASDAKSPDDAKKTLESKGYTFKSQKDDRGAGGYPGAGGQRRHPLSDDRRLRRGQDGVFPLPQSGIRLRLRHELSGAGYQGGFGTQLWSHCLPVLRLQGIRH